MNKIYCKEKLNKKSKKKFLLDYFNKKNPATFNNLECTVIQCGARKSRSIGDLKMLLDGAFKTKISENDLIAILLNLMDAQGENDIIRCLYCPHINKLVFYNRSVHVDYWSYEINGGSPAISIRKKSPNDGYCWNDLVEIYKTKQNERKNK